MSCPEGSFENIETNTCDCDETCATCSFDGVDRTVCSDCVSINSFMVGS